MEGGPGLRVLAAQVTAQHDGGEVFALPVGGIADGNDRGHEGIIGAHLDGDDVGLLEVLPDLRVIVLAAGERVHLAHLAGLDQLDEVGAHQAGQAEVDGVVAVQTEGLGDLAHIAGIRVALEVVGDIHTHQVVGVLHAGQADTGADAVAQCNIQGLLFLLGFRRLVGCFALGGLRLLFCGGLAEEGVLLFVHSLRGSGFRPGQRLFCKGRDAEPGKEHSRRKGKADEFFLHGDRDFLSISNRGR